MNYRAPTDSGIKAAHRTIRRTYQRVHDEYYDHQPSLMAALPKYLAETNVSSYIDDALHEYFGQGYDTPPVDQAGAGSSSSQTSHVSVKGLEVTRSPLKGHAGNGQKITLRSIPTSKYRIPDDATIPRYRFCRPVDTCVLRETERFPAFYHCVIGDHEDAERLLQTYSGQTWLHNEPDRQANSKG
jgi:hypothetical protein